MSDNARKRGRLAIYAMAGVFVLIEAYNLKQALPTATEYRGVMIAAIIIFGILGGAMIIFGVVGSYRLMKPGAKGTEPVSGETSDETEQISAEGTESGAEPPSIEEHSEE